MYESLSKPGSFRIDYLNPASRGSPDAFAFYVRGEIDPGDPYSHSAKHHLCAGLNIIRKNLDCDQLVAIYVDVSAARNLYRPAYVQMKHDLRVGYFRRVFAFHPADLMGDRAAQIDLKKLYRDVQGFDFFSYQEGRLQPESLEDWSPEVKR